MIDLLVVLFIVDWILYSILFFVVCVGDDGWGVGLWSDFYRFN